MVDIITKVRDQQSIKITSFLESLYLLDEAAETRKAVEQVVSQIDDALNENCFDECAEILNMADVDKLSPPSLLLFSELRLLRKRRSASIGSYLSPEFAPLSQKAWNMGE